MRTTKTWTISLPPKLVREALRMYLEEQRWRKLQQKTALKAQALGIRTEEDVRAWGQA